MKKFITILFAAICLHTISGQSLNGKIGVNIGEADFIDIIKHSVRVNYTNGSTQQLTSASLDSNMWPTCDFNIMWDWRPTAEWEGKIDDPEAYRINFGGVYHGSFTGIAGISGYNTIQNKVYDAGKNRTTFELVIPNGTPLIFIEFYDTYRTSTSPKNSGITNLKIIRPGYDTTSTQVFIDEFYAGLKLASFSCIRAMSLTGTAHSISISYPDTIGWKSRKKLTDAWWAGAIGNKKDAAPWEILIDLCNQSDMDMWINIPIAATDDYIVQLAKLIQSRLKPTLKVYVEISNEVWGFDAPKAYNETEAIALKITAPQNYARRAYRAAVDFEKVFGAGSLNNRIRVGLYWWYSADVERMCDFITKTYGPVSNYIFSIAGGGGGYFSNSLMNGSKAASVEEIVVSSYTSTSFGDAASGSIDTMAYIAYVNIAKKWGLQLTTYEGGAAMCNPLNPNTLTAGNCILAYRDSCMAASVRNNFLLMNKYGGTLACYFTLAAPYSRYGCWGLTDDIRKPYRNSLMKCMQELMGDVTTPTPPKDLFALKWTNNRYKLRWIDQASDETGFIIERKDNTGKYVLVKQVASNTTSYVDSLTAYVPKYYRIKALNANGTSTYANLAFVIDSTPPPAPKNLMLVEATKYNLKIKWNKAVWNNIKEYRVYIDGIVRHITTDTSLLITGLSCSKSFKINVVTISTSNIYSEFSDTLNTATLNCTNDLSAEGSSFSVYPNPACDIVYVEGETVITYINVIDVLGQIQMSQSPMSANFNIHVGSLASGTYTIQLFDATERVYYKRLVIRK